MAVHPLLLALGFGSFDCLTTPFDGLMSGHFKGSGKGVLQPWLLFRLWWQEMSTEWAGRPRVAGVFQGPGSACGSWTTLTRQPRDAGTTDCATWALHGGLQVNAITTPTAIRRFLAIAPTSPPAMTRRHATAAHDRGSPQHDQRPWGREDDTNRTRERGGARKLARREGPPGDRSARRCPRIGEALSMGEYRRGGRDQTAGTRGPSVAPRAGRGRWTG
jgi:hypothetical protein